MRSGTILAMAFLVTGCTGQQPNSDVTNSIAEITSRENSFSDYPKPNTTYLSFSQAHGFQVNYLAPQGKAWLWYPGNRRGVPEEYKQDVVSGQDAICWRHPSNSYNPVTRTQGGAFACQSLALSQRTIVAALPGDPFTLNSGRVPHTLERCNAPSLFSFNRSTISC